MQETEPSRVLKLCLAHRRESRWREIRPASDFGCWGCPGCGHDTAVARIVLSTDRGQLEYDYEVYIGEDEYDRDDGLWITVQAEYVSDPMLNCAWHAHLSGNFDISVGPNDVPATFDEFINDERFDVVRGHVYDHFTLQYIDCTNCELTIPGDLE